MFRRQFNFRRKAADDDEDTRRRRTLSTPYSQDATATSREPSPGGSSINSNPNSINRQITGSAQSSVDPPAVSRHGRWTSLLQSESSTRASESSGRDPLGLKVVHRPEGERRVDIVFVHGLGGSSRLTWSHNRDPDYFWPLKFLPSEPDINEARILTFGYNANFRPGSGRNKMSILDFAKDLLYDLKYSQDNSGRGLEDLHMGERPIIFIVHSMGGLIVKEAYMQGQNDPAYDSIISAVSAIIFLSTPHRGTNLAETLNRILQVSFATSPMQFISELSAGSQTLQKLNEQFRHVAPKLDIFSFYETRPTPLAVFKKSQIMVLEKDSSVLGYPGEISKPLDADHHGVCKYTSSSDPRYVTVRNVLKTLVGKVKLRDLDNAPKKPAVTDFAEYLSLPESPDADYNFFRDRWTPGTCSWILNNETFTGWVGDTGPKPRILWVHGNAASGKSILSSFLINYLVESGVPCHYFFIRFMSQEKRGMNMMLRSLAYQLANTTPAYAERLRQLEAAGTDLKTTDYRNLWQWLFKQALFQLDSLDRPLYFVIDGMDEADRPASIIRLLADLHATSLPIRLLMVGRNTHEISSAFQRMARQVDTESIRIEANPTDFRAYIDYEMDLGGDAEYRHQVTTQLLDRARGNFLWLHLAVQRINSCHTKPDVEKALTELPSGMEALYDRMALSVEAASEGGNRKLGQTILGWATCASRMLKVAELGDALGHESGLLEIHRTIAELCGGFVTVDQEGRVAMIHETAREYLTRGAEKGRSLTIDIQSTNDMLLKRCIARLTDPTLRGQINQGRPPPLLGYATIAWPHHLALSSALTHADALETVANFLKSPHVLTWIHVAAKSKELRALVAASRHLADLSAKLRRKRNDDDSVTGRQAAAIIEGWATDLVKILGKFGSTLRSHPDSIYKLIPPFCPEDSMIYRQFGRKESRVLHVSGFSSSTWDDCLARFSLTPGAVASSVISAGGRIALLSVTRNKSQIIVYNASTLEEQRRISHPERVLSIQANKLGDVLVSYGYATTRVWDVSTGDCLKIIKNPAKRPRPHSIIFAEKRNAIVVCGEDRRIRTCSLDDDSVEWTVHSQIDEETLLDTVVNFPMCSALSPDGSMVAFGYRNHPLTVWELEPPMLLGQCYIRLEEKDSMTIEKRAWGEVFHVAWHPLSGDVFGLTQVGLLFRWDPHEEETTAAVQSVGDCLAVNHDGSLVATGDGVGTIKIFAAADLSKLYQLSSQDPVLYLSFSTDSRRLYDVRGLYGNVWEPNTLVRLADCPDYYSDAHSETESLAKASLLSEHHFARVDRVISVAGQSSGPLYCYGTENGVATLCEAGRGKVCELARLASYMPIEHVAWSADGKLVALADLSGKLAVKTVNRSGDRRDTWRTSHEFEVLIPPEDGNIISQLIFHPTGTKLFVATPVKVLSVNVKSRTVTESVLETGPTGTLKVKWACHPMNSDTLLGFGNTKVHVFDWKDLRQTEAHTYFPPRMGRSSTIAISSPRAYGRAGSFQRDTETFGRLITNIDSPDILLEISATTASGQFESQYLLFDIANLRLGEADQEGPPSGGRTLPYTVLAADIASRIREPLAILSRRRLVFLDVDRWVSTWRLPSSTEETTAGLEAARVSDGNPAVEQYYFLPGDWVTGTDTRLCTVTPDGTLLCPRNGDVVTVQAARLRK
ncbi:hypothetical protein N656DRAFT_778094 [Canariomyces notabilis]|uniref:GPI inositol-deacylase n=1 Tax=Canariomyces notabilis TaxID=2074819 RepID=A0AAN6YUA4_9PEZI|nr:hypothetical protein N656DRAFT_778094 [Canariomyces arenarius]